MHHLPPAGWLAGLPRRPDTMMLLCTRTTRASSCCHAVADASCSRTHVLMPHATCGVVPQAHHTAPHIYRATHTAPHIPRHTYAYPIAAVCVHRGYLRGRGGEFVGLPVDERSSSSTWSLCSEYRCEFDKLIFDLYVIRYTLYVIDYNDGEHRWRREPSAV